MNNEEMHSPAQQPEKKDSAELNFEQLGSVSGGDGLEIDTDPMNPPIITDDREGKHIPPVNPNK